MGNSEFGLKPVEFKSSCEKPDCPVTMDMYVSNLLGKKIRGKESHYLEAKSSDLMSECSWKFVNSKYSGYFQKLNFLKDHVSFLIN